MDFLRNKSALGKKILRAAVILLIILCAAAGMVLHDYSGGALSEPVIIRVPKGAGTIVISRLLKESGAVRLPVAFRVFSRITDADEGCQPGEYALEPGSGYEAISEKMHCTAYAPDVKVLIREGLQLPEIGKILEEKGICGKAEFLEACENARFDHEFLKGTEAAGRRRLEGYLFPDTYRFYEDTDPEAVIGRMLDRFGEMAYTRERIERAEELGYSFDEMLTLASMLESEAVTKEDRRTVAGVFFNRLKHGDKLQSCVTVEFALGIHKSIISWDDTQFESPYNTYLHKGLPIGPICCPGLVSLDAALWPGDTDYYFFQSDKYGELWFARTYAEHARIARQVQHDWVVKTRIVGE